MVNRFLHFQFSYFIAIEFVLRNKDSTVITSGIKPMKDC